MKVLDFDFQEYQTGIQNNSNQVYKLNSTILLISKNNPSIYAFLLHRHLVSRLRKSDSMPSAWPIIIHSKKKKDEAGCVTKSGRKYSIIDRKVLGRLRGRFIFHPPFDSFIRFSNNRGRDSYRLIYYLDIWRWGWKRKWMGCQLGGWFQPVRAELEKGRGDGVSAGT